MPAQRGFVKKAPNKVFSVFRRDLARIARNPIAAIVIVGICVIPSLYAWVNILANWDPYENTSTIKVAVVDEDQGTTTDQLGSLDVGRQVVNSLRQNSQLGWQFTDEETALEGVRTNEYYAAIVIPKDFSADLTSILTGTIVRPSIIYYVNEKANAIAPKVTDSGASAIEQQINEEFVSTVTETVTSALKGVATTTGDKADQASGDLASRLAEIRGSIGDVESAIDGMEGTVADSRQAVSDAQDTLDSLSETSSAADEALDDADGLLQTTRGDALTLSDKLLQAISDGSTGLSSLESGASGKAATALQGVSEASAELATQITTLDGTIQRGEELLASLEEAQATAGDEAKSLYDDPIGKLTSLIETEKAARDELASAKSAVDQQAAALADGSSRVVDALGQGAETLDGARTSFTTATLPQLESALDSFSTVSGSLKGMTGGLSATLASAKGVLAQLDGSLEQTSASLGLMRDSLEGVSESLGQTETDVSALSGSAGRAANDQVAGIDAQSVGSFVSSPVTLETQTVYPVDNYGSGVAPFYTNLALWVGGLVLVAILKLEVDSEEVGELKPYQAYLGRWLLYVVLGTVQALVCCLGDIALLGIQCIHPVLFVLAGILASFVYVNVIYSLSSSFKHIGKALCVILVILQIPGSSGTYPIELMPAFFQALHPWLPFTYGINAMREAIAGLYGAHYAASLAMLALYVAPALLVGITARRNLVNINALFDKELAETDLMACERHSLDGRRYKLISLVRVVSREEGYREAMTRRAAEFDVRYPTLIRRGVRTLAALPLGLLVLLFVIPAKVPVLIIWIASIVVLMTALIVIEFLHESLARNASLAGLSEEEMQRILVEQMERGNAAGGVMSKLVDKAKEARRP
jgi:putative membrane protein